MTLTIEAIYPAWHGLTLEQRWTRIRRDHPATVQRSADALMAGDETEAQRLQTRADTLLDAGMWVASQEPAYWTSAWWGRS